MPGADDATVRRSTREDLADVRKLISSPPPQPPTVGQRIGMSPVAAFTPWAVYWLVTNSPAGWFYAAVAALAVAIIHAGPSLRGGLKTFDAVTMLFFTGLVVAGIILGTRHHEWIDVYSTEIAAAALAALAFVSVIFTPITVEYAREYVSSGERDSPAFRRINQIVTLVWGSVFAAIAVLEFVGDRNPPLREWAGWVLPIALFAFAVRFTQLYPTRAMARARQT
ncbi:MAG: hypothetical protein AB7G47_10995 [Mycolicibacterium sp.]|uniref:hypothetical protein n=1 Tax=Mycolicibacterium sp. TaxID=2320850 RepID=UPI003D13C18A